MNYSPLRDRTAGVGGRFEAATLQRIQGGIVEQGIATRAIDPAVGNASIGFDVKIEMDRTLAFAPGRLKWVVGHAGGMEYSKGTRCRRSRWCLHRAARRRRRCKQQRQRPQELAIVYSSAHHFLDRSYDRMPNAGTLHMDEFM
jgi:hypothetical protein